MIIVCENHISMILDLFSIYVGFRLICKSMFIILFSILVAFQMCFQFKHIPSLVSLSPLYIIESINISNNNSTLNNTLT